MPLKHNFFFGWFPVVLSENAMSDTRFVTIHRSVYSSSLSEYSSSTDHSG